MHIIIGELWLALALCCFAAQGGTLYAAFPPRAERSSQLWIKLT
jgi:hypothetical protein